MSEDTYTIQDPHSKSIKEVRTSLDASDEGGLSDSEVKKRREAVGPNQLEEHHQRGPLTVLLDQFKSVVIGVLVIALAVALAMREWPEAIAVAAVIVVNTVIGFIAEWRAILTIDALQKQEESHATVVRDGKESQVAVRELVPGDRLRIKAGELTPADARLVESKSLRVNEAALTGEAEPVVKHTEKVGQDSPLAERLCMLYKGCSVVDGHGEAIVTATGMRTELGKIARSAMEAESTEAPLRERLDRLGRRFVGLVIVSAIVVGLVGWWRGRDLTEVIETAIALGIAAVPEGLPIVATIALAHGMWLMGKRNAVVKNLQAVQSLGSVPILFVDKTGTLTQNRMRLMRLVTPDGDEETEDDSEPGDAAKQLLEIGALCNRASLDGEKSTGDPMEVALLEAARKAGLERKALLEKKEQVRLAEFERETMMMAAFNRSGNGGLTVSVKGAPERVLEASVKFSTNGETKDLGEDKRSEWEKHANDLAAEGYRVLGAASKEVDSEDAEPYEDLVFCGYFALEDPLRENVTASIDECEAAGIKVIMITGDKRETAEAIARQAGIGKQGAKLKVMTGRELRDMKPEDHSALEADVIARVEPQQKLDLIKMAQAKGEAVGMTGDGVNDAPALKRANIGIAMGQRGTDAAKQVADIVLRDDALSTIVEAVRRGRTIMDNIRKAVMFFLCTNLAEIIAVTIGVALAYPLPLLALQILYLNVITDVFPALALSVGPAGRNVMEKQNTKAGREILNREHWLAVIALGVLLAATTLAALIIAKETLGLSDTAATTVSFLTLGFSKVWFPFILRDPSSPLVKNEITLNPWIWGAITLCAGLLVLAVYFRPLGEILRTAVIPAEAWLVVLTCSLLPLAIGQIALAVIRRRSSGRPG